MKVIISEIRTQKDYHNIKQSESILDIDRGKFIWRKMINRINVDYLDIWSLRYVTLV